MFSIICKGVKKLTIHYGYNGIESWIEGHVGHNTNIFAEFNDSFRLTYNKIWILGGIFLKLESDDVDQQEGVFTIPYYLAKEYLMCCCVYVSFMQEKHNRTFPFACLLQHEWMKNGKPYFWAPLLMIFVRRCDEYPRTSPRGASPSSICRSKVKSRH